MTKLRARSGDMYFLRLSGSKLNASLIGPNGQVVFVSGTTRTEFEKNLKRALEKR